MNDVSEITIQSSIVFHDSTVRNENSKLTDIVKTTDLEIQVSKYISSIKIRYSSRREIIVTFRKLGLHFPW